MPAESVEAEAHDDGSDAVGAAVTRAVREHSGRLIALLAHRFGDLDLADEVVHEAFVEALTAWRAELPQNPAAWLMTVARNRAVDRLRREAAGRRRLLAAAPELVAHDVGLGGSPDPEEDEPMIVDDGLVPDERLRLILLCCHPALDRDAQVALTLRLVGGLSTPEIAAAFLLPEATLAQRIVRAKRKIRVARIPLSVPADPAERAGAVLTVLALVFNEGYLSRAATTDTGVLHPDRVLRPDLAEEAIRLTRVLVAQLPQHAEVAGLLALMLLQHARLAARLDEFGEIVLLEQQDRTRWNRALIAEGDAVLSGALARMEPGPWQVQALIAAQHAHASAPDQTDWHAIAVLYGQLVAMTGSPVVGLNHAVAVAMTGDPRAGLALLTQIDGLDRYHLRHAAQGELLLRLGDAASATERAEAVAAFERALPLTGNAAEQSHLRRRLAVAQVRVGWTG